MRAEAMDAHNLAFVAGGIEISVEDVARALAVHDGRGEDMNNEGAKAIRACRMPATFSIGHFAMPAIDAKGHAKKEH
jgi:hypothetical protein